MSRSHLLASSWVQCRTISKLSSPILPDLLNGALFHLKISHRSAAMKCSPVKHDTPALCLLVFAADRCASSSNLLSAAYMSELNVNLITKDVLGTTSYKDSSTAMRGHSLSIAPSLSARQLFRHPLLMLHVSMHESCVAELTLCSIASLLLEARCISTHEIAISSANHDCPRSSNENAVLPKRPSKVLDSIPLM